MDLLWADEADKDAARKNLGSKWVETDRLFVKWNGEPQHPNTTYTWFLRFCERNNFRFCDIHSMRHFYASALINECVDAAAVSGALGHSVIGTTVNLQYGHNNLSSQYSI